MPKGLTSGSAEGEISTDPYTTIGRRSRIKEESLSPAPTLVFGSRLKRPTWKVSSNAQTDGGPLLNRVGSNNGVRAPRNHAGRAAQPRLVANHSLRQAECTIKELRARILVLERSQKRFKKRASVQAETLKDSKEEGRGRLLLLVEAESKLEETEHTLHAVRQDADRYRNWWLAEYHSLKAVTQLIPPRHDVEAIASSSLDRYRAYSNN